jgi:uncharacterized membrane-anchored protein YjiN (DUF445 family)
VLDVASESYDAQKLRDLRRMKLYATSLLVVITIVFVITLRTAARWPSLAPVRAFAEAAMVGACADWFAVVALFRHPFGLPIPHTGIIPRSRERLGDALGRFIATNFLSPTVLARRLARVDVARQFGEWLTAPGNARFAALQLSRILQQILHSQPRERWVQWLSGLARRGAEAIPAAPAAARLLALLWSLPETRELLDRLIVAGGETLLRHKEFVREKVAEKSSPWLRWADGMLSERITRGLYDAIGEMRDPDHPFRVELDQALEGLVRDLAEGIEQRESGERIKLQLLASGEFRRQLDELAETVMARFDDALLRPDSVVTTMIEHGLRSAGEGLLESERTRTMFDRWVRRAALRALAPRRADIGAYISGVVAQWHTSTLVRRLELQIGSDLQYIRINGTLVGGLVGLLLFELSKWLTP